MAHRQQFSLSHLVPRRRLGHSIHSLWREHVRERRRPTVWIMWMATCTYAFGMAQGGSLFIIITRHVIMIWQPSPTHRPTRTNGSTTPHRHTHSKAIRTIIIFIVNAVNVLSTLTPTPVPTWVTCLSSTETSPHGNRSKFARMKLLPQQHNNYFFGWIWRNSIAQSRSWLKIGLYASHAAPIAHRFEQILFNVRSFPIKMKWNEINVRRVDCCRTQNILDEACSARLCAQFFHQSHAIECKMHINGCRRRRRQLRRRSAGDAEQEVMKRNCVTHFYKRRARASELALANQCLADCGQ